jgi:hypothetical protein
MRNYLRRPPFGWVSELKKQGLRGNTKITKEKFQNQGIQVWFYRNSIMCCKRYYRQYVLPVRLLNNNAY